MTELAGTTITRADPLRRLGSFLIESVLWGLVYWMLSASLPWPGWAELIGTWPLYIAYKTVLLQRQGAHLGHRLAGIRIVDYRTGGPLSWSQAAIRTVPEFSHEAVIPLLVNVIMVTVREDHRSAFDLLAGTIAVRADEEPAEVEYEDEETAGTEQSAPDPEVYRESERPPFT